MVVIDAVTKLPLSEWFEVLLDASLNAFAFSEH